MSTKCQTTTVSPAQRAAVFHRLLDASLVAGMLLALWACMYFVPFTQA